MNLENQKRLLCKLLLGNLEKMILYFINKFLETFVSSKTNLGHLHVPDMANIF